PQPQPAAHRRAPFPADCARPSRGAASARRVRHPVPRPGMVEGAPGCRPAATRRSERASRPGVTAAWAVSASDAVLAGVAIWVCVRFAQAPLPVSQRLPAAAGALLIAAAAVVGCLRFAGLDALRGL